MPSTVLAAAQSISKRGSIKENVRAHIRLIRLAAEKGASLIIFPELSLTGYEPDIAQSHALTPDDPGLESLQAISNDLKLSLLVGAPFRGMTGFNIAAFLYQPYMKPQVYTKHYLHPGEDKYFHPGDQGLLFNVNGVKVAPAICADISHHEHPVAASEKGASVYAAGVMITPNGYLHDSELLRGYAVDHELVVLLSNYGGATGGYASAGRSAVWGADGELLVEAPVSGEAVVLCFLDGGAAHGEVFLG